MCTDTEYFDIVAGVLQGDTLAPYLFIICLDYVLRTSIDKIKENGCELTKKRSRRYPATTITDADYADDIAILANTPDQVETLLHSLERAAASIGLYVNAHKTEYMCYNQTGDISTLEGTPLKLVDKFTYLGSSVESTEKDMETRLTKAWTAINRLSIIWKSDLTDKMKRSFFQAAVTSILLYGCTTWTLTKRLEKKLDGNYTRMLRAILNKSWQQHPTRHQLYGHLPPITKTIQVRRTRHAGHCWRSRDELIRDVLLWIPKHGFAKAGRPARTYIQQLREDTGYCPEDLPRAMNDREEWWERVRDIRVTSAIWWWSLNGTRKIYWIHKEVGDLFASCPPPKKKLIRKFYDTSKKKKMPELSITGSIATLFLSSCRNFLHQKKKRVVLCFVCYTHHSPKKPSSDIAVQRGYSSYISLTTRYTVIYCHGFCSAEIVKWIRDIICFSADRVFFCKEMSTTYMKTELIQRKLPLSGITM